tara:strand:- start:27 stop:461 length:435 start_codon:yes stop_codon:yes gene_type:complete
MVHLLNISLVNIYNTMNNKMVDIEHLSKHIFKGGDDINNEYNWEQLFNIPDLIGKSFVMYSESLDEIRLGKLINKHHEENDFPRRLEFEGRHFIPKFDDLNFRIVKEPTSKGRLAAGGKRKRKTKIKIKRKTKTKTKRKTKRRN